MHRTTIIKETLVSDRTVLFGPELGIERARSLDEVRMTPSLHHSSFSQYQNFVSIDDGGQTMSNKYGGLPLYYPPHGSQYVLCSNSITIRTTHHV